MAASDIKQTTFEGKLIAAHGSTTIDDTALHTNLVCIALIAQEDTAISAITGFDSAGNAVDFIVSRNWDTLKSGALHIVPDNWYVKAITLTSGSLIIYE